MKTLRLWLSSLPSEYQLCLVVGLFMIVCYFLTPSSSALDKNLGTIITGLGSLAGAALLHGGISRSRWARDDSAKDLIGTEVHDGQH